MASNLNSRTSPPAIFYSNPLRMAIYVLRHFGVGAMVGLRAADGVLQVPGEPDGSLHAAQRAADARRAARATRPNERRREQIELAFTGSAMDLIDRFLPDRERHRTLRALVAFAAVQSTYKGPFTPGSALLPRLHLRAERGRRADAAREGRHGLALGGAVPLDRGQGRRGAPRRRRSSASLIEDGRAVGVELRDGERITRARGALEPRQAGDASSAWSAASISTRRRSSASSASSTAAPTCTCSSSCARLPRYGPPFEHLNADPRTRFNTTLVPDPELQQASYEACRRGELPEHPPVGMQIPTVMDPSLAPDGFHIATTYGFFFPCDAPSEERGKLRDEMAERIIDRLERVPARLSATASSSAPSSRRTTSRRCRAPPTATSRTA